MNVLEKAKITNAQSILLFIVVVSSTGILFLPTIVYEIAKRDTWLTMVLVGFLGTVVAYIITKLGLMFKDKTIIQYSEIILGKVPGKIVGLIYCAYFIHLDAIGIREFSELLVGPFFPGTPILFFTIAIMLVSIYAVYSGIEVIARVNEFIFPLFMIAISGIIFLSIKDMDFNNFLPILEGGWMPVIKGTYHEIYFISEMVFLLMLIPYINKQEKVQKSVFTGVILLALLGMVVFGGIGAVFGAALVNRINYPFLALARYVSIGDVATRIESLVMFMWVSGVFIKITILHYCAVLAVSQWLNLKVYKPLVIPIGAIMVVLSMIIAGNVVELGELLSKILIPYLIIEIGIPFILLIVALLRKKGSRKPMNNA